MIRAKTADEYIYMIRSAISELDEMCASLEFDEDSRDYFQFIDDLKSCLKHLNQSMLDGTYSWRTGDLPYMDVIRELDAQIMPLCALLTHINETHTQGLESE